MQASSIATSCCSRINLDVEMNAARSTDFESESDFERYRVRERETESELVPVAAPSGIP